MSDPSSSDNDCDSHDPWTLDFSTEDRERYRAARDLLPQSTRDLFDTLSLVGCREIPYRVRERFENELRELRRLGFVYVEEETYLITRSSRLWNWDRLQSNQADLQAAFDHACAYYEEETLDNRVSVQQQAPLLDHVEELAQLYHEKDKHGSHAAGYLESESVLQASPATTKHSRFSCWTRRRTRRSSVITDVYYFCRPYSYFEGLLTICLYAVMHSNIIYRLSIKHHAAYQYLTYRIAAIYPLTAQCEQPSRRKAGVFQVELLTTQLHSPLLDS